jgi:hypothetical protein
MTEDNSHRNQRGPRQKLSDVSRTSETQNQGDSRSPLENQDYARDKRRGTFRRRWRATSLPNKLMILATIVIAAATVVNMVVSVKQWGVANDSLQLLKSQQRPWVGVESVNLGDATPPNVPSWNVNFKNFGPLPAPTTKITSAFFLAASFENVKKRMETIPMSTVSAPTLPGQQHQQIERGIQPMSANQWELFNTGTETLYILGRIDYTDTSNEPHVTYFCVFANGRKGRLDFCSELNTMN